MSDFADHREKHDVFERAACEGQRRGWLQLRVLYKPRTTFTRRQDKSDTYVRNAYRAHESACDKKIMINT